MRFATGSILSALALTLTAGLPALEAAATFAIQPGQSVLQFTGGAFWTGGSPLFFEAQPPDGFSAAISGDLVVDLEPGTITFLGGVIDPAVTGDYLPGNAPGDYGFQADSGLPDVIGALQGAVRGAQFAPTSTSLAVTPTADGWTFDLTGMQWTGLAGVVDFDGQPAGTLLGSLAGVSHSLVGLAATSVTSPNGPAALTVIGSVATLTLPVQVTYENFEPTEDITWQLEGTIVATRVIPEPATLVLFALGALAALRRGRPA